MLRQREKRILEKKGSQIPDVSFDILRRVFFFSPTRFLWQTIPVRLVRTRSLAYGRASAARPDRVVGGGRGRNARDVNYRPLNGTRVFLRFTVSLLPRHKSKLRTRPTDRPSSPPPPPPATVGFVPRERYRPLCKRNLYRPGRVEERKRERERVRERKNGKNDKKKVHRIVVRPCRT